MHISAALQLLFLTGCMACCRFWKRAGYKTVYVRQTCSDLTGEHTCIGLKRIDSDSNGGSDWLTAFEKVWFVFPCVTCTFYV